MEILLKTATLIVVSSVAMTGQVLIKKGLTEIGPFRTMKIVSYVIPILTNVHILLAMILYGIAVLLYFSLLSRNPLGVLYPIAVAFNFIIVAIASAFFLGEPISALKLTGLFLILGGITCVAWSNSF